MVHKINSSLQTSCPTVALSQGQPLSNLLADSLVCMSMFLNNICAFFSFLFGGGLFMQFLTLSVDFLLCKMRI